MKRQLICHQSSFRDLDRLRLSSEKNYKVQTELELNLSTVLVQEDRMSYSDQVTVSDLSMTKRKGLGYVGEVNLLLALASERHCSVKHRDL